MTTLAVELDDDLAAIVTRIGATPAQAARQLIITELYRRRAISTGKAAESLGMALLDFIRFADGLGIPYFRMTEGEWEAERRAAEAA